MKWALIGLVLIGVAAAVSAAALMATLAGNPAQADPIAKASVGEATIYVAARPLAAVSVVPADALVEKVVSADQIPRGALREPAQVIGKVLMTAVAEGQAFTSDCFASGATGLNLAGRLPPGKRAVTISLTEFAAMDGLLYPGATVDVLAAFSLRSTNQSLGQAVSTTLLHNVQVLAVQHRTVVDEPVDEKDESKTKSLRAAASRGGIKVTLLVDSRQAKALQLAAGHGTVSLAMRNPTDAERAEDDPTLLNRGQLAQLAQLLEAQVDSEEAAAPVAPPAEPEPVVAPPPAEPVPAPAPKWDIHVFRGTEVQVRSFDIEPPSSEVAP